MNVPYRAWLPDTALSGSAIAGAIGRIIAIWAADWFAAPPAFRPRPTAPVTAATTSAVKTTAPAHVHVDDGDAFNLGRAIASLETVAQPTSADRAFFQRLTEQACADLATRLGTAGGGDIAFGASDGRLRFAFESASPATTLLVDVSAHTATQIRRFGAGHGASKPALADDAMHRAVHLQQVQVGTRIGMRTLPLHAVKDLAVGDTLILDTLVNATTPLVVDGHVLPRGCVRVVAEPSALTLVIDQPVGKHA